MAYRLWQLFMVFSRIGLFSIGGGYVMLPLMRREMVVRRGWLTDEELVNYYAIGQAAPGIIAINTATFTGYKRAGLPGAIAATAGMIAPSLLCIILIALFVDRFQDLPPVQKAFRGIRVAVTMLLAATVAELLRKTANRPGAALLSLGAFAAVAGAGLSPIPVVILAGLIGFVWGAKLERPS